MKTIIIAEDPPISLNGIELYVKNLGYTVVNTYQNGLEDCNGILELQPDYAILYLNMTSLNGMEVL